MNDVHRTDEYRLLLLARARARGRVPPAALFACVRRRYVMHVWLCVASFHPSCEADHRSRPLTGARALQQAARMQCLRACVRASSFMHGMYEYYEQSIRIKQVHHYILPQMCRNARVDAPDVVRQGAIMLHGGQSFAVDGLSY